MTDLERLLEAEGKLTPGSWIQRYQSEGYITTEPTEFGYEEVAVCRSTRQPAINAEAIVFIRNHLRPVLERAQRIEEAARRDHGCPKYRKPQSVHGVFWFDKNYPCGVCTLLAQGSEDG